MDGLAWSSALCALGMSEFYWVQVPSVGGSAPATFYAGGLFGLLSVFLEKRPASSAYIRSYGWFQQFSCESLKILFLQEKLIKIK